MATVTDRQVDKLLRPRSIAVVGASTDPQKRGHQAVKALLDGGFEHPIYPINPTASEILGLRAYPSVTDVGAKIDLALVVTPAATVPAILRECAQKGVAGAVVIAVGFGEAGGDGRVLEEELLRIVRESGIRVVGPNTSGLFNLAEGVNLVGLRDVPRGQIAVISQSGNVLLSLVAEASSRSADGFSVYVGVGNEIDVRFDDILAFLRDDPRTGVVVVYAEGFRDGRAFLRAARATALVKPIVMLKSGRSEAGRVSALSHTGALAGSAKVADAALRQAGAVVVRRLDELLTVAAALGGLPSMHGPRVAVLADGGGHATIAADAIAASQLLQLPELSATTRARLAELLPAAASVRNPVDVAGATDSDPALFAACLQALADDDGVDALLMVGLFGGYGTRFSAEFEQVETATARELAAIVARSSKPLVVQSAYASVQPPPHAVLRARGIPVHDSIEVAVRCLLALRERSRFLESYEERSDFVCAPAPDAWGGARLLLEPDARRLLEEAGVSTGEWGFATSTREVEALVERLGRPVALKVVSAQVPHKSDVGGVRLGLHGRKQARDAYRELVAEVQERVPEAEIAGVLAVPMAAEGIELVLGAARDPTFGPVVMLGLGGVLVEGLGDVTFRGAPVTIREVYEMLDELHVRALLDGARGHAPVDRSRIAHLLRAVSELIASRPEIVEIDLNPVIAADGDLALVDVRVAVAGA